MNPARAFMVACGAFCLTPWASVQVALGMGIALALLGLTAWNKRAKALSRLLIQVSIVLLGFWISLSDVARAGASGAMFSGLLIVSTFALGAVLARLFATDAKLSALLSSGTAICGGSAIAATGATIRASDTQISVALVLVFVLNTVAVYAFPPLGHALGLSQQQFGAWAAVAVHDVANLVATAKVYGDRALADATVIKLTRVLWLAPICLALGWWFADRGSREGGLPAPARGGPLSRLFSIVPWFVLGFVLASLLRTLLDRYAPGLNAGSLAEHLRSVSKTLLTLALFFIGCGLSRKAIGAVGLKPMLHGTILWVIISVGALLLIRATVS